MSIIYLINRSTSKLFNKVCTSIDAAGALHHVIARGIHRGKIFQDPTDKRNFIDRLAKILKSTETRCFASAIIPNHFNMMGILLRRC
jgi:hypothetical protein